MSPVTLLDFGSVELLGVFGSDIDVATAAWVSTEGVQLNRSPLPDFIDYLMRHKHMGPFEMVEFKFRIKAPLIVARQWMRHRTGSFNEISGRYVTLTDDVYDPVSTGGWRSGSAGHNKQGSSAPDPDVQPAAALLYEGGVQRQQAHYHWMLEQGVAPELARLNLTLGTYTEFIWKVDLRNLLGFLLLRDAPDAQFEIREFAKILLNMVREHCPYSVEAWENHHAKAVTFSRDELAALREVLSAYASRVNPEKPNVAMLTLAKQAGLRVSRTTELSKKFKGILGV